MNDLLEKKDRNRINDLLLDAKAYAQQLNIPKEMIPQIEQKVSQFQTLLKNDGAGITKDATNAQLFQYFSLYEDPQVKTLKSQLLTAADGVVRDEKLKAGLGTFMDNLVTLNTNNRFLEYKYVSLNIFMMAVLNRLYVAIFQFMDDVKKYNELRAKSQSESANELVKKLYEIMEVAKFDIDPNTMTDVNASLKSLLDNVDKWKQDLDKIDDAQRKKFVDILNVVGSVDDGMMSMKPSSSISRSSSMNSSQYGSTTPRWPSIPQPLNIQSPVSQGWGEQQNGVEAVAPLNRFNGGFIRSGTGTGLKSKK